MGGDRTSREPRGSRRLWSQSLLDVRLSKALAAGPSARIELLLDVLNALNSTAEESLATDNRYSPNFGVRPYSSIRAGRCSESG